MNACMKRWIDGRVSECRRFILASINLSLAMWMSAYVVQKALWQRLVYSQVGSMAGYGAVHVSWHSVPRPLDDNEEVGRG